jgi:transposase
MASPEVTTRDSRLFPTGPQSDSRADRGHDAISAPGRGYDSEATRALLRWLGIEPHIARRKTPHGSGLDKVRWVMERTIAWLKRLRRLRVRYDRLCVIMDAWTTLATSIICSRYLHQMAP